MTGQLVALNKDGAAPFCEPMRYRALMTEVVSEIVAASMDKKTAGALIKRRAIEDVPQEDRARFTEVVETEVMNLHEGNIARYRLQPSRYHKWKETWW